MMPLWYALNSAIDSFVRIRTEFRLARRSKWRNDGPERAYRPPPLGALCPAQNSYARGSLLPIISWVGFVRQLSFVRIRTEFRLAKRSKGRKTSKSR